MPHSLLEFQAFLSKPLLDYPIYQSIEEIKGIEVFSEPLIIEKKKRDVRLSFPEEKYWEKRDRRYMQGETHLPNRLGLLRLAAPFNSEIFTEEITLLLKENVTNYDEFFIIYEGPIDWDENFFQSLSIKIVNGYQIVHIFLLKEKLKENDSILTLLSPQNLSLENKGIPFIERFCNDKGYYFQIDSFTHTPNFAEPIVGLWEKSFLEENKVVVKKENNHIKSDYIIRKEKNEHIRKTKFETKQQAYSNIKYTFTYQENFEQQSSLQEESSISENQEMMNQQTQTYAQSSNAFIFDPLPIALFVSDFHRCIECPENNKLNRFFTNFYIDNYSRYHELWALRDSKACVEFASKLFSFGYYYHDELVHTFGKDENLVALTKDFMETLGNIPKAIDFSNGQVIPVFFPKVSFGSYAEQSAHVVSLYTSLFSDGFPNDAYNRRYSHLWSSSLFAGILNAPGSRLPMSFSAQYFSHSILDVFTEQSFSIKHMLYKKGLSQKNVLLLLSVMADENIDVFRVNHAIKESVKGLNPDLSKYFNKLMTYVQRDYPFQFIDKVELQGKEHHLRVRDIFRIMVNFIAKSTHNELNVFANLLKQLDERSMLPIFYRIYLYYGYHFESLFELYRYHKHNKVQYFSLYDGRVNGEIEELNNEPYALPFINLVSMTPISGSPDDWSYETQFLASVLVYGARCYMNISALTVTEIRNFWVRFKSKCMIYCNHDRNSQEELIKEFLKNIENKKLGLSLEPLRKIETLLTGLELILDNAIAHRTLREQITELPQLSLKWIDALHAITYEHFPIVSSKMLLESGKIGYKRKLYTVTLNDLYQLIKEARPGSYIESFFSSAVFRYLAKERFRLPLCFYKKLIFSDFNKDKEPLQYFTYLLLFAKYVAESTGLSYRCQKISSHFEEDSKVFLERHPAFHDLDKSHFPLVIETFKQNVLSIEVDTTTTDISLFEIFIKYHPTFLNSFEKVKDVPQIPEIFYAPFEKSLLQKFLFEHKKVLNEAFSTMNDNGSFAISLLRACFLNEESASVQNCLAFLYYKYSHTLYFSDLFKNFLPIMRWVDIWQHIHGKESAEFIWDAILVALKSNGELALDVFSNMVIFLNGISEKDKKHRHSSQAFLKSLSETGKLSIFENASFPLDDVFYAYEKLFLYYERSNHTVHLNMLIQFGEYLENASSEEEQVLWRFLLQQISQKECYPFFVNWLCIQPSYESILSAVKILKAVSNIGCGILLLDTLLMKCESPSFDVYYGAMKGKSSYELQTFTELFLDAIDEKNIESDFCRWISFPVAYHKMLHRYYKSKALTEGQVQALLSSGSPEKAIEQLELELNQVDMRRYDVNKETITAYISEIRRLPNALNVPARALSEGVRSDIWTHYQRIMGAMREAPVFAEVEDGETKEYTLSTLPRSKFKVFFKELCKRLQEGEDKLEYRLLVLALASEGLFRTTGKFPRSTQLISLIHSIVAEGNLIKEVRTGEGKSILAALEAIMMIAEGNTVFIATENEGLAREGLFEFQDLFECFDIPLAPEIIEAHTAVNLHTEGGVHYGTPYGFSLFFIRMAFAGMALPPQSSLIIDEFDSSATSTVQFRLAATLDPILLDTKKWTKIYRYLLDFVVEKDIFLENFCSSDEDVSNFFCYCLEKDNEASFTKFVGKLNVKLLSPLIDAALLAKKLEVGVDFLVVKKEGSSYCAPILPHTSRADPRAQFEGAQAILHERESKGEQTFKISPSTETVVCISAKNFIDMFRLKKGRCIALTGTPGCHYLIKEFETLYGMRAFHYANFNADNCRERKTIFVKGLEEQWQAALSIIQEVAALEQPILLHVETAKSAGETEAFLRNALGENALIQTFDGYCATEEEESAFLKTAGKPGQISVTTFCHARGIDIKPGVKKGLFEIDCCTDKTEEQARQIRGRTSRNGEEGDYVQIIDIEKLSIANVNELSEEDLSKALISFMQNKTAISQHARLRTRPLEEGRFLIVNEFFEISRITNVVLARQFGFFETLIPHQKFLEMLRDFYDQSEANYEKLLGESPVLTEEKKEEFVAFLIQFYNAKIEEWLPASRFSEKQLVELSFSHETLKDVPSLNALPVAPLAHLSSLFQLGFEAFGDQPFIKALPTIQNYIDKMLDFIPQAQDVGLKTFFFETLINLNIINDETLQAFPKHLDSFVDELDTIFQDMKKQTLFEPIAKFVEKRWKKSLASYLAEMSQHIKEKNWEKLYLPYFLMNSITSKEGLGSLKFRFLLKLLTTLASPILRKWYQSKINEYFPNDKVKAKEVIKSVKKIEKQFFSLLIDSLSHIHSTDALFRFFMKDGINFLLSKNIEDLGKNLSPEFHSLFLKWKIFCNEIAPVRDLSLKEFLIPARWQFILNLLLKTELLEILLKVFPVPKHLDEIIPEVQREKLTEGFFSLLALLNTLDEETLKYFYHFDLKYAMPLFQVLIHPSFSIFLQSLETENLQFADVLVWLDEDIQNVPLSVQEPLQIFRDALDEQKERLEEQNILLNGIHQTALLTSEKLKDKWDELSPDLEENDNSLEALFEENREEDVLLVENNEETIEDAEEEKERNIRKEEEVFPVHESVIKRTSRREFIKRHPLLIFFLILSAVLLMMLFSWLILPVLLLSIPLIIASVLIYVAYHAIIAIHAYFSPIKNIAFEAIQIESVFEKEVGPEKSEAGLRAETKVLEIENFQEQEIELINEESYQPAPLPKITLELAPKPTEIMIFYAPKKAFDYEVPALSVEVLSKKIKEALLSEPVQQDSIKKEEKIGVGKFFTEKKESSKTKLPSSEGKREKIDILPKNEPKKPSKSFFPRFGKDKKVDSVPVPVLI